MRTTRSTTDKSRVGTRNARPLYQGAKPKVSSEETQQREVIVREFSIERRNDLSSGFGSTSGRRGDVVVDATSATPVLVGWAVDSLLSRGGGVNGSHQTFDNTKGCRERSWQEGRGSSSCRMHSRPVVHLINTKMKMDDRCVRTTLTAGSYLSRLTPHANMGASADGAEMMTFFTPAFKCLKPYDVDNQPGCFSRKYSTLTSPWW